MSSQLVFLSLFLGLVSGRGNVDLQAGPAIASVHILLDSREVAVLQHAPWRAAIDFGPAIVPRELVAVGYDDHGNEIARTKQSVNLPRPTAEFVIALQHDDKGAPVSAELRWEHLLGAKPVRSTLTIDGKSVPIGRATRVRLPPLDMNHPHLIAAEMRFADGFDARREIVVGGAVSGTAEADLTPISVRQPSAVLPANLGECFTAGGAAVRVAAVEKGPALVIAVLDPDPREASRVLDPKSPGLTGRLNLRHLFPLDPGTRTRILWPVAQRFTTTSNASAVLFPPSEDLDANGEAGLMWLLTRPYSGHVNDEAPRLLADAVGVAGLNAMTGAHRRAVILVLSRFKDASTHDGVSVRGYLAAIGVPLFVWSLDGPRPDLRDTWGDIDDISSPAKLKTAGDRLRAELATQRVAWVAADPVTALRIQPAGQCGIVPLARASSQNNRQ
jgi:hypothetical protein